MQAKQIRKFLLAKIPKHSQDIVAIASEHFNVSRTTIHRHLNSLLKKNQITKIGTTRQISYHLAGKKDKHITLTINANLSEDEIWGKYFVQDFKKLDKNVFGICEYGFTEICNNALDHSNGSSLSIKTKWLKKDVTIIIKDNGIGIFQKLTTALRAKNAHESAFHLSKGKLTTDKSNHTGEGIFFSSRIFDFFKITSDKLSYYRDNIENDFFIESESKAIKGTEVTMCISLNSKRSIVSLFKAFQDPKTLGFVKTQIDVKMVKLPNESYISRSQAKRLLQGLEKFTHIILNFKKVRIIGQGFADQIFRVYKNQRPEVVIEHINTNKDIQFMIKRSEAV